MLIAAFFIITKSGNPNTVQSGERIEKCGVPTKRILSIKEREW